VCIYHRRTGKLGHMLGREIASHAEQAVYILAGMPELPQEAREAGMEYGLSMCGLSVCRGYDPGNVWQYGKLDGIIHMAGVVRISISAGKIFRKSRQSTA